MPIIDPNPDLLENCWRYFVLGVIQGLTEFLPISSTAHLTVIPALLGWEDIGVAVTAVLQLGSILAVITYFRKDLLKILKGLRLAIFEGHWKTAYAKLGIAMTIGTIPIVIAGLGVKLLWPNFEESFVREIPTIAIISILMGALLGLAERTGERKKTITNVTGVDGLVIGLSQTLALLPGVSRSGITLTSSLFSGWKREDAARFSFLLGIPAISIAGLAELSTALSKEASYEGLPLIIGIVSASIVSWLAIDWLLKYLQRNKTIIFVIYRISFGIGLLFWWSNIKSN